MDMNRATKSNTTARIAGASWYGGDGKEDLFPGYGTRGRVPVHVNLV